MDTQDRAFENEVMGYQRTYPSATVIEVARHFGMDSRNSDIYRVQDILNRPEMRRYRKAGSSVAGPIKAGPNSSQRHRP